MAKKWTPKEAKLLKKLAPKASKEMLLKAFPGRSWDSIERKIGRMGLKKGWLEFDVDPHEDIRQEIDRQRTQETKKAYKEVIKERAFETRLINTIKDVIAGFPPAPPPVNIHIPKNEPTEEAAVLLLSDIHAGEVVDKDEMLGLSQYDFETFVMYTQFLVDTVIDIIDNKLRQGFNIQDLHIHALGDMVSGIIHEEFLETNDANIFHSAFGSAFVLAQAIRELSTRFRIVYCDCIPGNHGRLTKDRRYKEKWNNWDFVCYNVMATLLANQPNIRFNIPYSSFVLKKVMGHTHLLSHGDNVQSYYGIPLYGLKRMAGNFTEAFAAQGEYIQFFNVGHFHSKCTLDRLGGELIVNGGWKGGDEYSLGKLHTVSEPKQVMYGVHPRRGKTWEFDVNFRFAQEQVEDVRYSYDKRAQWACQVREKK